MVHIYCKFSLSGNVSYSSNVDRLDEKINEAWTKGVRTFNYLFPKGEAALRPMEQPLLQGNKSSINQLYIIPAAKPAFSGQFAGFALNLEWMGQGA